MTLRTIAVVFLALACGAFLAFALFQAGNNRVAPQAATVNTEFVVVAARPILRYQDITKDDLAVRSCSKEWVTEETFSKAEDLLGTDVVGVNVVGEGDFAYTALASMDVGDLITTKKVVKKGSRAAACLEVKPGLRAYTIQTSRVASNVAGFIMPGNKVDVLLNMKGSRGDASGGGSTTTLLQCVEVLAVAQMLDAPKDYKVSQKEMTSVTLHVTPQQANDLDLGQNMGVLTLSLRNPNDDETAKTDPSTIASVQYQEGQAAAAAYMLAGSKMVDEPLPPESETTHVKEEPLSVVTLRGQRRGRVYLE